MRAKQDNSALIVPWLVTGGDDWAQTFRMKNEANEVITGLIAAGWSFEGQLRTERAGELMADLEWDHTADPWVTYFVPEATVTQIGSEGGRFWYQIQITRPGTGPGRKRSPQEGPLVVNPDSVV